MTLRLGHILFLFFNELFLVSLVSSNDLVSASKTVPKFSLETITKAENIVLFDNTPLNTSKFKYSMHSSFKCFNLFNNSLWSRFESPSQYLFKRFANCLFTHWSAFLFPNWFIHWRSCFV